MIIQPSTSNVDHVPIDSHLKSSDQLIDDVQTKFWVIFIFYICCSVAWVAYCLITYRRDMEQLEEQNRENGVSRFLELQRLLDAYNRIDIEGGQQPLVNDDTSNSVK